MGGGFRPEAEVLLRTKMDMNPPEDQILVDVLEIHAGKQKERTKKKIELDGRR